MTVRLIDMVPRLTRAGAEAVLDAAAGHAAENGWAVAIAIVDHAGALMRFDRADGAPAISVDAAIGKARTAAAHGKASADIEKTINEGRVSVLTAPGLVALPGGRPLLWRGTVIGAIGVSGVAGFQDDAAAKAGCEALAEQKIQSEIENIIDNFGNTS